MNIIIAMNPETLVGQRYTGPWISNNKFQSSVAFGDQAPLGALDSFSRLHDTARAVYQPGTMWKASDSLYHDRVSKLPGTIPSLAGDAVLYGNAAMNSAGNIASRMATGFKYGSLPGALAGLVVGGVENMLSLNDYMTHSASAKKKILAMEKTDPFPQFQLGPQIVDPNSTLLPGNRAKRVANSLKVEDQTKDVGTTKHTGSLGPAAPDAVPVLYTPSVDNGRVSASFTNQRLVSGEYENMVKDIKQNKKLAKLGIGKGVAARAPKHPKQSLPVKKPKVPKSAGLGPVSAINTAPVAIGNSVSGCETTVLSTTKNGVMVRGRDYMFTPIGTKATIQGWTMVGGSPLAPGAFADTTIANYMRIYQKFRFKGIVVHYITSSATSDKGDIMFYYGKDRSSVYLNQSSSQLLGFVLSDADTVIGPQWTNHSASLNIVSDWKYTDYGMHDGIEEYAAGEVFLLSRTSTTESPGYVLFDYIIEFAEHQLQPRLLEFPIPRIQYSQLQLGVNNLAVVTTDALVGNKSMVVWGNNMSGTASQAPSGYKQGDIYKMIIDVTNSDVAPVNCTYTTAWGFRTSAAGNDALTIKDGMTLYAVINSWGGFSFYTNCTSAYSSQFSEICWNVNANVTLNLQVWLSYVGSVGQSNLVPNY